MGARGISRKASTRGLTENKSWLISTNDLFTNYFPMYKNLCERLLTIYKRGEKTISKQDLSIQGGGRNTILENFPF